MRVLVVLCVLAAAVNAYVLSSEHQWAAFKLEHSKQYALQEEKLRFEIFKNNLRKIEEHNTKYNAGEVSYYLAVNHFADLTSEEFMAMVNSQISTKPTLNASLFAPDSNAAVPDSIDWNEKGAVTDVQDQGECHSCWSFSAAGALESQIAIKTNKKLFLSKQQLVDCSSSYGNKGCKGGLMDLAFQYVKDHGICSEDNYPYIDGDGKCKTCSSYLKTISGYKTVPPKEDDLKSAVGTVGPVSIGLEANFEWQLYGGGIFDHLLCTGLDMNHGVLAVGYGSDNHKDYWLIKNSWGSKWGEKGYIRLVRGKNQCGVANMASYPTL